MTLAFACHCGQTQWHVADPQSGTRVICYCADCQSAARHLGADVLDPGGGTDILQLAAHQISLSGTPLALMRLSPRGLFRWHSACCGTPVANTLPFAHLSFAGVLLANHRLSDDQEARAALPKPAAHVNTLHCRGKPGVPAQDRGMGRAVFGIFKRGLAARLDGRWRETPFFTGPPWRPVADPKVLSLKERNAARP